MKKASKVNGQQVQKAKKKKEMKKKRKNEVVIKVKMGKEQEGPKQKGSSN